MCKDHHEVTEEGQVKDLKEIHDEEKVEVPLRQDLSHR